MAVRTSYLPGTPCWVDVMVDDVDAAVAFYGGLLGWNTRPTDERFGGYTNFELNGHLVAGIVPKMPGTDGMPDVWSVYTCVTDAAAALDAVTANGGSIIAPAMDVAELGSMGIFADPNGVVSGVWKPGTHLGAEWVNEPGGFAWSELATPDPAAAEAFYTKVFGWGADGPGAFTVEDQPVCGFHPAGPGEFPAWSIWFAVESCEASAATVTDLGGSIIVPPNDMGFGIGSVVSAPGGAVFGIADLKAPAA